jgi:hypothetical protein
VRAGEQAGTVQGGHKTMARWTNIEKMYFDRLQRTGNALGLLERATAEIILDNNTFWRPEHKQKIFEALKNAFVVSGLYRCRQKFTELVNAGKSGKLSVIGEEDIQREITRYIVPSTSRDYPDYEEAILAIQEEDF